MAGTVQSPEKELRFTRSGQATLFWMLAAVCFAAAATWFTCTWIWDVPKLWTWAPLTLGLVALRMAIRLTRHAYIILTPLGLEVFSFFRPQKGLRVIYWQEIEAVEMDDALTLLTLHFDQEQTSGMHLTLLPIHRSSRSLLAKAVRGRVSTPPATDDPSLNDA